MEIMYDKTQELGKSIKALRDNLDGIQFDDDPVDIETKQVFNQALRALEHIQTNMAGLCKAVFEMRPAAYEAHLKALQNYFGDD